MSRNNSPVGRPLAKGRVTLDAGGLAVVPNAALLLNGGNLFFTRETLPGTPADGGVLFSVPAGDNRQISSSTTAADAGSVVQWVIVESTARDLDPVGSRSVVGAATLVAGSAVVANLPEDLTTESVVIITRRGTTGVANQVAAVLDPVARTLTLTSASGADVGVIGYAIFP